MNISEQLLKQIVSSISSGQITFMSNFIIGDVVGRHIDVVLRPTHNLYFKIASWLNIPFSIGHEISSNGQIVTFKIDNGYIKFQVDEDLRIQKI